jgi:hypothetical protein
MMYIAHITGTDRITRRYALIAFERDDAYTEARLLAASMFSVFTFSVRQQ